MSHHAGQWVAALVECPICNHRHASVHPATCERIECPRCGYMMVAPPVPEGETNGV